MIALGLATISLLSITACSNNATENNSDSVTNTEVTETTKPLDTSLADSGMTFETLKQSWNNFITNKSLYFACYRDYETYDILLHNTSGESLVQTSEGILSIYMKDGHVVSYGDTINYGYDLNAIDLLSYALKAVDSGIAVCNAYDLSEDYGETTYQYNVDIRGIDNIEKFYSQLDAEFGKNMAQIMYESITTNEDLKKLAEEHNKTTDDISYRFVFLVNETSGISECAFDMYFGADEKGNEEADWADVFTVWWFNKYFIVDDWQLDDIWYTYDFYNTDPNDQDQVNELIEMASTLSDNVGNMISNFFDENFEDTDGEATSGEATSGEATSGEATSGEN